MAEITDRETHTRKWSRSFHTAEPDIEYDWWEVWYHGAAARLNFQFGTAPVYLVLPEPRVVSAAMAREDREARERLEAEATTEANMDELRRRYPELVEAERAIFPVNDKEVIVISDDEGGEDEIDSRIGGASFPTTTTTAPARTQLSRRVASRIGSTSTSAESSLSLVLV